MKRMFEAVEFSGSKLIWDYRNDNSADYHGYYHWHQCCEMLYVHEGAGRVVVNGETFTIREGMLFFFRPYQLHHVYANTSPEQPYTRSIVHFDPLLVDELLRPFASRHGLYTALWRGQKKVQAFDLSSSYEVVAHIFEDYAMARCSGYGEDPEEFAMLILRMLDCIIRSSPDAYKPPHRPNERNSASYVHEAMQWIDEHFQNSFHFDDLADTLHISKFYLSKLFHEETGSTLKEYITAMRMRQACRLLETTTNSVEWIGNEVGIPNASYFVRVFKQEVGTTPLRYRTGFTTTMNRTIKGEHYE